MACIASADGTNTFTYLNKHNQCESIHYKVDDQKNLFLINDDGAEEALLKLDCYSVSTKPIPCENYNDIKWKMENATMFPANVVFQESFDLMEEYYAGEKTEEDIKDYIKSLCQFSNEWDMGKPKITKTLSLTYEYLSRANTRNAVEMNMQEEEQLIIESGLREDTGSHSSNRKGIVYYNADYYYACKDVQSIIKDTLNELAETYGVEAPDYATLDENTMFPDGGITYNGVWNNKTFAENTVHYYNEFSLFNNDFVPSKAFLFCEVRMFLDDITDLESPANAINNYVNSKLHKNTSKEGNHELLLEMQRRNVQDYTEVNKAMDKIRKYFKENDISYHHPHDKAWLTDYVGMIYY